MTRKSPYDPLAFVPPPEAVRDKLAETETLACRLRILLDLAERIHAEGPCACPAACQPRQVGEGAGHVD